MNPKILILSTLAIATLGVVAYAGEQTRFSADASEWDSGTTAVPGVIIPVGGSGQVNGNFVLGERNGVQIAIRAQRRFFQNVDPLENHRDKQVGVYLADTGTSEAGGIAKWNYDLHLDLRGAHGVAKGTKLSDYTFTLATDIGPTLFLQPLPLDLASSTPNALLLQTSLNPKFGNPPFDATAEGTYHFTLTLTPLTFKGPPIVAEMRVEVTNP